MDGGFPGVQGAAPLAMLLLLCPRAVFARGFYLSLQITVSGVPMSCSLKVSSARTKDGRSVCDRKGKQFNVSGALAGVALELCYFHRRQLQRLGLKVEPVFVLAKQKAAKRRRSLAA